MSNRYSHHLRKHTHTDNTIVFCTKKKKLEIVDDSKKVREINLIGLSIKVLEVMFRILF